jgi:hypothetical protein
MLPDVMLPVPASLASLLAVSGPLFTAPSFRTFYGLGCGFLAQTGKRDGMRDAGRGGIVAGLEP